MNAGMQKLYAATTGLVIACMLVGCTKSDSDSSQAEPAASGLLPTGSAEDDPTIETAAPATPKSTIQPEAATANSIATPATDQNQPRTDQPEIGQPQTGQLQDTGLTIANPSLAAQRELRSDLSPVELVEFLAGADKDMQLIASGRGGITDPRQARAETKRISKLKLEASRRLKKHSGADLKLQIEGARGELQSLSTLASLGDAKSADELETLATENLKSNDPSLVSDSQMVLIGFAIESLQAGSDGAAERIVELIEDLASAPTTPELPAMMVMGQAREVLAKFDHVEKAKQVRDKIIELFADSSDPHIARMAAQFAGNVRFDSIDQLRSTAVAGQTVSIDRWREAAGKLIDESPDLLTVQYLAGAALEFEAIGNDELAAATYGVMTDRFTNLEEATTREVKIAVEAREARLEVIGKQFDPDLPSTGAAELSMEDYRGKIVLMPFWASGFPASLQVVPMLTKLRDEHPDQVAIVGMNLDPAGSPVDTYADKQLGFPSYRSVSTETATMGNPVAARFGVVSMPFVAIINQQGKIEAIDFSGRKLEPTIQRLLADQ